MRNKKRQQADKEHPNPSDLDALVDHYQRGRLFDAERLGRRLTAKFPNNGVGWKVLGASLHGQNRYSEALHATIQAAKLLPDDAAVHNNLGATLLGLGQLDEAEANIRKSLAIAPDYAKAHSNLGTLLRLRGLLLQAEVHCRRAVAIAPEYTTAHVSLGNAQELQNKLPEAITSYRRALEITPNMPRVHTDMLHLLSLDVHTSAQQLHKEHLAFGAEFEPPLRGNWQAHDNTKEPLRLLKVGFVSSDLYNHALANYFEPLFKYLSPKSTLSLHLYCTNILEDAVTERLRTYFGHWHSAATWADDALEKKIRDDKIDILFDLNGHTVLNRLLMFARKPAPIQASWLGYLGTTGLQAMDYWVSDSFWIPPGELDWQFTEKLAYLPNAVVFQPNPDAPEVNDLPALAKNCITFGSFNRQNKVNDSVIALWAALMHKVPHSRMVLGAIPLEHQERVALLFKHQGVEPDRLAFYGRISQTEYLRLHHLVDLCLDTFPYGGGATTAHAAWMGVPTLSLMGETPASRFGASEMHHLGLDGFIARSIEDFVEKGTYWATHVGELAKLRQGMRARFNASPLGQHPQFADNFETMLRAMWQRWCDGLAPSPLVIKPAQNAGPACAGATTAAVATEPSEEEIQLLRNLYTRQQYAESESLSRRLAHEFPEHGLGWKYWGSSLRMLGRLDESLSVHQQTACLRPDDYEAQFNLACELQQQGHLDEAVKSYVKTLGLQPNNANAYCNLGNIFHAMGLHTQAEMYCRQALALQPSMEKALNNLGNTLHAQGKLAESQQCYEQALALRPDWAEAYNNLAICLKDRGLGSEARDAYRAALTLRSDWAAAHSNMLYCLSLDVHTPPEDLFAEHQAFGEKFEAPLRSGWQVHANTRDPDRVLRIGFVSGDLYDHALANFLEPVFNHLGRRTDLTLHAYYTHIYEDAVTTRMRNSFAQWRTVAGLSDTALADQICVDGIDVLIDLSGHTAHNRLLTFARKPAPVQASWLGYLGTSGMQAMDYWVCDPFWVPLGQLDWQFTEKLAYLPAAVVFAPDPMAPAVNTLPALTNGHITFGSFNRFNKLNHSVIVLWCMLMRSVPSAKMVLGGIAPESQEDLLRSFSNEGIDICRLAFFPRSNMQDYLALHHQIDFCLDTFPYGGGATTAHAAWMGVPTLCLAGDSPPSRFGATELHLLGLDAFIASSIEDFLLKGVYWSENVHELSIIRRGMRDRFNASAFGQPENFSANFAVMLRAMWQRWCVNATPAPLTVSTNPY